MLHFIWVFNVCQCNCFDFPVHKKINIELNVDVFLPSNSSEYMISFFIMGKRRISFHATWRNPSLCNNWAREVSLIPGIDQSIQER